MSEISLAVGDGARRMTYAELAQARGISLSAARRLTLRHHWPKQTGNDGFVRVSVPLSALGKSRKSAAKADPVSDTTPPLNDPGLDAKTDTASYTAQAIRALEGAVEALREQLGILNQRIEEERARADRERDRADQAAQQIETLRTELAETRIAGRVATTEANDLFRRLDQSDTDRRQALDRLAAAQERIAVLLTDQRPPARRSWWRWR